MVSEPMILDALHHASPRQFEQVVAMLMKAQGYKDVRVQGGANDRGVDILCRGRDGRLVAVQCKRFAPTTAVNAITVQHLVGMTVKRSAHRGMLVTTGGFTRPARAQAKEFDLELVDGPTLASLVARYPDVVATLGLHPALPRAEPAPSVPEPLPTPPREAPAPAEPSVPDRRPRRRRSRPKPLSTIDRLCIRAPSYKYDGADLTFIAVAVICVGLGIWLGMGSLIGFMPPGAGGFALVCFGIAAFSALSLRF